MGAEAIASAVALAREADAALLFVGLNGEWDGEGLDRPHLSLPRGQNELIEQVAAVNRKTIVVLQSGCPVLMPWLDKVAAVLQAWYPGQEVGNSIADVLLGLAEPGGRLPQTFPRRMEDDPASPQLSRRGRPRSLWRGLVHRLSLLREAQGRAAVSVRLRAFLHVFRGWRTRSRPRGTVSRRHATATLDLTNTGARAGSTVVQVYVADEKAGVVRPEAGTEGFCQGLAGARTNAARERDPRHECAAVFDVSRKAWVAEAGRFVLRVGFSSADIVATAPFVLTQSWIDESPRRALATNR